MSRQLLALVLASSVVATGCVAHGQHRGAADVVNGVLVVGGLALAIGAGSELNRSRSGGPTDDPFEDIGRAAAIPYLAAVTVIGLGLAAAGGVGFLQSHMSGQPDVAAPGPVALTPAPGLTVTPVTSAVSGSPVTPVTPVTPTTPVLSASYAVHLTAQARTLAATGQCGAVRMLDADVAAADGAYHARVFRTDPALAACLAGK